MSNPNDIPVSLVDLGMAYRKAKADLYYSSHASILMIARYEKNLLVNLKNLQKKLNQIENSWVTDKAFLGGWTLVPKAIEHQKLEHSTIWSTPKKQWQYACKSSEEKPTAEFRLMADVSMDFHVLSALWIEKVGQKYDSQLSDDAWGNRLKRNFQKKINHLSIGSIKPYFHQFRLWRDIGIRSMRQALNEKKKIVAITVDVESFYHELSPDFMENQQFLNLFEMDLSGEEQKLNHLFLKALKAWAIETPLQKGLPVGLPASAIIANMAFCELDRVIRKNIDPLYYGRYVDDIILVFE